MGIQYDIQLKALPLILNGVNSRLIELTAVCNDLLNKNYSIIKSEKENLDFKSTFLILKKHLLRFHNFYLQLNQRYDNRPPIFRIKDEYDVQDIVHAIRRLNFNDIRREDQIPNYAGSASRIDFLLPISKNSKIFILQIIQRIFEYI